MLACSNARSLSMMQVIIKINVIIVTVINIGHIHAIIASKPKVSLNFSWYAIKFKSHIL